MSTFTPGPWWVVCGDESDDWAHQWPTIMSSTKEICGTEGFYGDLEEDKANAALAADAPSLLKALEKAVAHIERNTCLHEETYRGGAIWEICHQCGAKWADDEGGKPEFKWPEHVEQARALISKHRGES